MFADIRNELTRDFLELKQWILFMPNDREDVDFFKSSRGLFFVYAYGLYEKIVHEVVCETINSLNDSRISIDKCIYDLYDLIFSDEYDGLYNVGREHKWEKRWIISEKFRENSVISISNIIFPTDGKNIRYRQLDSIAKSFGLRCEILPRKELGGYIEELVNNRNHIAHGNQTPKEVGKKYTKNDLIKRCDVISEICSYLVDIYENYILSHAYIK